MKKTLIPSLLACAVFAALSAPAVAADWQPTKPIRMLVGFAPGGGTDTTARAMGVKLGERLGQQIIIDNRPGAAGNIATEITANSAPDGYTVLMGTIAALAINPSLYKKLPVRSAEGRACRYRRLWIRPTSWSCIPQSPRRTSPN